jgi:uncharacterized protein
VTAMEILPISVVGTGILGIFGAALAIFVIVQRVHLGVEWGDGGNIVMAQAVRAHANFAELVPLALLAIGAAEIAGTSRLIVIGLVTALIAARVLSALGLSRSLGPSIARQAGASVTILVTIIAGACAIGSYAMTV